MPACCRRLLLLILCVMAAPSFADSLPPSVDAAKAGDWALLQSLLEDGTDPDIAYGDGTTALHWASYHDHLDSARRLLEAGADVNATTDLGVTALWLAAENGSAVMVELLLQAGADPGIALRSGETPLVTAALTGNARVVSALLAAGADPNTILLRNQTALMWAANQQHAEVVKALLQYGADPNVRTETRTQYIKTEKPQDSHPDYKTWVEEGGYTPLMFAARAGDLASARELLAAGADVNAVSAFGISPAIMAVNGGNPGLLALLLDSGADIDESSSGHTALHAAVLRGDEAAVRVLLEHGADLEIRLTRATSVRRQSTDYHFHQAFVGATALWLAARFAEPAIMARLLQAGADPLVVTRVTYPAQRGLAENYQAEEGDITVLMAAVGMGHRRATPSWGSEERRAGRTGKDDEDYILEAVRLAIQAGVELNRQDAAGQSALAFAKARRYESVVALLTEAGAIDP
ncbi:MAG: Phosphocholine transferase AnkX [Pseudomonadota bacterium]|jgi:ankyrin repeat protein